MKKVILLAGYPATGKTYMSNKVKEIAPTSIYISQDVVKELLYDTVGFDNIAQKNELVEYARTIFYESVRRSLKQNSVLILDYPFSYKQIDFLNELSQENNCEFLTIRLTGDLDVLYKRRVERDLVSTRNKGHILECYHGYETYERHNYPLTKEQYESNCLLGKYNEFEFGTTIEIDVTDYNKIDYVIILSKIRNFLGDKCKR